MTVALSVLLAVLLALVFVPVAVVFVQTMSALLPAGRTPALPAAHPRVAVLVPAHDESAGIRVTLESVLTQLAEDDRLVVVADNCSDDTAEVAAAAGAEVVERVDLSRRGKGYALDVGVRHLASDPPQVVVIVDADCTVAHGVIERIAQLSFTSHRPVQARYLIKSPAGDAAMAPIAEFACLVRNLVRPLGFHRLGLPCQLMGSGMAIPWSVVGAVQLASGHIVEDIKMGLDFARAGSPPLFCPEALVESFFPANQEGTESQRTRWEHGHLSMIVSEAPRLLVEGLKRKGSGLLPLALDLCVPPLALLGLMLLTVFCLGALHAIITGSLALFGTAGAILLVFILTIALAWLRFGYAVVSLGEVLLLMVYMVRKVPLYAKFLLHRQVEWVRSKRDGG